MNLLRARGCNRRNRLLRTPARDAESRVRARARAAPERFFAVFERQRALRRPVCVALDRVFMLRQRPR